MADPGFVLPPRWKVARLLGRGGQAVVCLAEDTELGEWVAVKVFHPGLTDAARGRIRREVRLGRSLQHPGLVRVFELIESGDRLAVVMELVSGGSVAARLEAGPLAIDEVVRTADETLAVLAFLHREGVVHRDIKPSNLLLDAGGRVRVADLGLVRRLDDGGDLTRTATTVGTPQFMSPEQIRGERAGPPADLYSLGVTLFHLLTGKAPFQGASEFEVAHRHLRATPPDPRGRRPDCPRWLARFVLRLLEKAPGDRFRDGAAALEALRRRRAVASPRFWRRAGMAAVVVGAALAGTLGVAQRWRGSPARAIIAGSEVVVTDRSGRELWRRRPDQAPFSVAVADLMSEGSHNVAMSLGNPVVGHSAGSVDIRVYATDGEPMASLASTRSKLDGVYPELSDRVGPPTLVPFRIDPTGAAALAWLTPHSTWYPSVVGVWAPRAGVPEGPLLYNSGHLHHLVPAELDGDGRSELVAAGLNNPIGYQGVLVLLRPHREWHRSQDFGYSPDLTARWAPYEIVRESPLIAYTPFGQTTSGAQVREAGGSGISVVNGGVELRFDRAGNPLSSPLAGRGVELRQRFWVDLGSSCRALESGGAIGVVIGPLEATHREALSEPPMRFAAELLLARALARGGRHEEAASRLRDAVGRSPEDVDLWLRLGEQLALAGHPAEAVEALDRTAPLEGRGRGPVDYTTVKAFIGSWTGKARWLEEAKARWAPRDADSANEVFGGSLDVLWAFCRGRWDDPSFSADRAEAPSAPWAQVLVAWAELERGRDARASVAIAERLQDNAEVRELAMLLRAAALLRLAEMGTATDLCRQAVAGLERKGRTSVQAHVWTALAHRVAGDASLAAGDSVVAERHFRAAARIAPACWFGRRR